jgi:demethylmenaquinone methyltransferase/2-methoxy-6-polyprenyl-1,4-benzoquinol methylase
MRRAPRPPSDLLAEQIDSYEQDAVGYDAWLDSLSDGANLSLAAVTFRAGQAAIHQLLAEWAPLGQVLEIAAGTGSRTAMLAPYADRIAMVDSSATSLTLAERRLGAYRERIELLQADIFEWSPPRQYDLVCFFAWLHHVPEERFDRFWAMVGEALAPEGLVLFDYPTPVVTDAGPWCRCRAVPTRGQLPDEPSEEFRGYPPSGGISIRDLGRQRWRVVHLLWDPDELTGRLDRLGWCVEHRTLAGPDGVRLAVARRAGPPTGEARAP